jgi:hypothetical protein
MRAQAWPYVDLQFPFSVDEGGSFAEYILKNPESMPNLALGSRVLIHDTRNNENIWMEATVVGIRGVSPFQPERQNLLYIQHDNGDPLEPLIKLNGPHKIQEYLIRVRLNKELAYNDIHGRFDTFAIQRPPSASSFLTFPSILPSNSTEPSLADMLEIKQKGIKMGAVGFGNYPYEEDGSFLIYHLDIESLDNKHMFIVGESGSGKTVLLKKLALEIRSIIPDSNVIMTDVQGDLSQILLSDIIDPPNVRGWQSKIDKLSKDDAIQKMQPFNLIIPASKSGLSSDLIALMKLARNRGVNVKEIGLRLKDLYLPSEVEYLYRVTSDQVAMLLDEEAEFLKTNNNYHNMSIDRLRSTLTRLITQGRGNEFNSSMGTTYYKSTGSAALRALKNLENYFDFHQSSLSSPNNPLDCFLDKGTSIFYLEHLDFEERLMWEMQLVKWLYSNKNKLNNQYFVFLDEAHQIIPAKPPGDVSKGTFDRLRNTFEKLSREGRKFGINLILSTQNPNDLHEIVPEQCPTRIVMKIDPKNASSANLDKELANIASRFSQGQFWLKSPFNGTAEWVRIHSWASSLPHQPMITYWSQIKEQARKE